MDRFGSISIDDEDKTITGVERLRKDDKKWVAFHAQLPLLLISEAWNSGCSFEDLADGFGPGKGTMGGDWSGIRDSSHQATEKMLARAMNHLFPFGGNYPGRRIWEVTVLSPHSKSKGDLGKAVVVRAVWLVVADSAEEAEAKFRALDRDEKKQDRAEALIRDREELSIGPLEFERGVFQVW